MIHTQVMMDIIQPKFIAVFKDAHNYFFMVSYIICSRNYLLHYLQIFYISLQGQMEYL